MHSANADRRGGGVERVPAGMSIEQILADFPELTVEDLRACLAYAADRERRLMTAASTADSGRGEFPS